MARLVFGLTLALALAGQAVAQPAQVIIMFVGGLSALAISPTQDLIAVAGPNSLVEVLNWRTGKAVARIESKAASVLFSQDGNRLAVKGSNGIMFWSVHAR